MEHGLKLLLVLLLFPTSHFAGIVTSFTVAVGLAAAVGFFIALWLIPSVLSSVTPAKLTRQAYLYSLPVFLMSIAGFISLEIDTIMLKSLRNDVETGIYSAARQIIMLLPHLSLALSMGTIPGISVFTEANAQAQRRVYYQVLAGIAALYIPICAGLVAFAFWGLRLFFRPEYQAAAAPLLILIPFALFNAATIYSGSLMVYRGLAWRRSLNVALSIALNILLNWWLIPRWGAVGAATASSIAYLPACLLNLRAAHKVFALSKPV